MVPNKKEQIMNTAKKERPINPDNFTFKLGKLYFKYIQGTRLAKMPETCNSDLLGPILEDLGIITICYVDVPPLPPKREYDLESTFKQKRIMKFYFNAGCEFPRNEIIRRVINYIMTQNKIA